MITKQVNFNDFWTWLQSSYSYKNNFSYQGAKAVFHYMEDYQINTGATVDFDPVAWCCEFTEYKSMKELKENYSNIKNLKDLEDNTTVISTDPLVIVDF